MLRVDASKAVATLNELTEAVLKNTRLVGDVFRSENVTAHSYYAARLPRDGCMVSRDHLHLNAQFMGLGYDIRCVYSWWVGEGQVSTEDPLAFVVGGRDTQ